VPQKLTKEKLEIAIENSIDYLQRDVRKQITGSGSAVSIPMPENTDFSATTKTN
jgi:hypothetical protein